METATQPQVNAPAATENVAQEILFREGIIGVPKAQRFLLLEREGHVARVLKCLDIKGFALPVVDPLLFDPDYKPTLGKRFARVIELEADDPVVLLAVATLEPGGPMANLRAPLVINARNRRAMQVILESRSFPLRAPMVVQSPEVEPAD
ncbi:hypothetical protein ABI59_14700 [Acidobacteria bacterium Mor1]|nr:hypothetical protein ABI59_14700 [Acidobacteria bacterium Mor1]